MLNAMPIVTTKKIGLEYTWKKIKKGLKTNISLQKKSQLNRKERIMQKKRDKKIHKPYRKQI